MIKFALTKRNFKWLSLGIGIPIVLFITLMVMYPLPIEMLYPSPSVCVEDSKGRTLRVYTSEDDSYYFPCKLEEVSPYLIASSISFEDRWFYYHPGFNPFAIVRAMWMNIRAGRIVSGGSTITQQVARLMNPKPRNVTAKLIEAFRTVQLELKYSKDEILQFYFNLAPYGGNIYGVSAASKIYFGKEPENLGPGEAALLAALPNSPTRLRPDRHPEAAKSRRDEVLKRMFNSGEIDSYHYRISLDEDVPRNRIAFPLHAPHLCDYLYAGSSDKNSAITSSIDLDIQELCRRLLNRRLTPLRERNISNGAIVIIDNKTSAVRALIGSDGYFDEGDCGLVNGALASRSPGSTLKPFAYGIALDMGFISPASLLEDIPHDYNGYSPENYDKTFNGVVTVESALIGSMNVPVVNLVNRMGYSRLYDFLKRGGITTIDRECEYYGLQMILGGVGVNLLELTNLYSTVSRGGEFRTARFFENPDLDAGKMILSKAACYILTEILSQVKRPDFPSTWENTVRLPKVAWKTGTSYGHRDAWSIGYTPRYTVGVWIGNFSGVGSPDLVGADIAGPLLFDIFSELARENDGWFEIPKTVETRQVCELSGMIPGPFCTSKKSELYIPGVSPHETCDMHVQFVVDGKTGYQLCSNCWDGIKKESLSIIKWHQSISSWKLQNGYPVATIPSHNPNCRGIAEDSQPVIKSPSDECEYVLRDGIPLIDQKILLEAAVPSEVKTIFWFMDGNLLYKGPPGVPQFFLPERGSHIIVCMDDEGRQTRQKVVII